MALRGILIGAAATVALAAAVALLGPRLIDGEATRSRLEATVSAITGGRFEVNGAVDATLFPRPQLVLAKARLVPGNAEGDAPVFAVDRIELRPDLRALLGGRLRVAEIRLVRPLLDLTAPRDGIVRPTGSSEPTALGQLAVGRFAVIDGRLVLPGRDGTPVAIEGIAVEGSAETLLGPWQASGAGRIGRDPVTATLEVGRIDREGAARVVAELGLSRSELRWTGRIWTRSPFRADGRLAVDSSAARELVPLLPPGIVLPEALLAGRLRFAGTIAADGRASTLRDATIDAAGVAGRGSLSFEDTAVTGDLVLERLDLSLLDGLVPAGSADLPTLDVQLRAGTLTAAGRRLGSVDLALAGSGTGPVSVERLRAELAGRTTLRARGQLALGGVAGARFTGSFDADAETLRAALLEQGVPEAALPASGPGAMVLAGEIELDRETLRVRDLDLQLEGSRLGGSLVLRLAGRPQLAASMTAERLDLRPWLPPLVRALSAGPGRPFDAALDLRAARVLVGGDRLDTLVVKAGLEGGTLRLQELAAGGDESVRLQAGGSWDATARTIDAAVEMETPRASRLLRLLELDVPWLARLEPLRVSGTLRGPLDAATIEAEGTIASARTTLVGTASLPDPRRRFDATLRVEAPDAAALARELGAVLPLQDGPPLALEVAMARPRAERVTLRVEAGTAGTVRLRSDLALEPEASPPRLSGRVETGPGAVGVLDAAWSVLAEPLGLLADRPSRWLGAWPRSPLAWDWLDRAALDLDLVGRGEDGRTAPLGTVRQRDQRLSVTDLDLPLGGGRIGGEIALTRRGIGVELDAELTASGVTGLPLDTQGGVAGRLDGAVRLEAHGRSLLDLARTLAGDARATLIDVRPTATGVLPVGQVDVDAVVAEGVARGSLAVRLPGSAPLAGEAVLDVPAWMLDASLPLPTGQLRLLGPPGGLRAVTTPVSDGG